MSDYYKAHRELLQCALTSTSGIFYSEDHPENPNGDAQSEYHEDWLYAAARKYVDLYEARDGEQRSDLRINGTDAAEFIDTAYEAGDDHLENQLRRIRGLIALAETTKTA